MSLDAITRMMNSFKHFEKKLDKLQDDVNYQGQTLLDLRLMVMNLSAGNIASPDTKSDDMKSLRHKPEAARLQHEDKTHHAPVTVKTNRQVALKSLQINKIASQKRRLSSLVPPAEAAAQNKEAGQVHMQRHRKSDITRKGIGARAHKKNPDKTKPVKG